MPPAIIHQGVMDELASTVAAILAGGLGTRLRSVVPDKPKVLADVGGRPFIEYLLDQLASQEMENVVLCVGYLGDMVRQRLGASYRNMSLVYSQEKSPLGTGGALRLALPLLDAESILVMNGDSYCSARLKALAAWHRSHDSHATILLARMEDTRRYGRLEVDDAGRIVQFQEKSATSGPGWVNGGIYLLRRALIESIPADRAVSLERDVFPHWIGRGLHGFPGEGRLWDIGVPEAYAVAKAGFLDSISQ